MTMQIWVDHGQFYIGYRARCDRLDIHNIWIIMFVSTRACTGLNIAWGPAYLTLGEGHYHTPVTLHTPGAAHSALYLPEHLLIHPSWGCECHAMNAQSRAELHVAACSDTMVRES